MHVEKVEICPNTDDADTLTDHLSSRSRGVEPPRAARVTTKGELATIIV